MPLMRTIVKSNFLATLGLFGLALAGCGVTPHPDSGDGAGRFAKIAPKGCQIPDDSVSPEGHYGVTVPETFDEQLEREPKNSLIDLRTGRVVAAIEAKFAGYTRMNHGGCGGNWSKDSSLLLWEVGGKWSNMALTLLKIDKGEVVWQTDILRAAQTAILKATQAARPSQYAAAKAFNAGNGSAYPEGFTVQVNAWEDNLSEPRPVTLPMWVSVILTANPKAIEDAPSLHSYLLGKVDQNGRFSVKEFSLTPIDSPHFNGDAPFN